ncbi:hypothetical protein HYALB_00007186 [Hymenoscyphus albidus]|uniref:Secreted protein n=1 Tax=Hymenoscyphus albidus TaxID=595503 RepID=A0A9N9LYB6_9HELO|nr:hypothetical protein HYALB_00007186 [Hymenoscyphus albidus]
MQIQKILVLAALTTGVYGNYTIATCVGKTGINNDITTTSCKSLFADTSCSDCKVEPKSDGSVYCSRSLSLDERMLIIRRNSGFSNARKTVLQEHLETQ